MIKLVAFHPTCNQEAYPMDIYQKLSDWLVPTLLGAGIYQLQRIAGELKTIGRDLAIVATRVDAHEQRIDRVEEKVGVACAGSR